MNRANSNKDEKYETDRNISCHTKWTSGLLKIKREHEFGRRMSSKTSPENLEEGDR